MRFIKKLFYSICACVSTLGGQIVRYGNGKLIIQGGKGEIFAGSDGGIFSGGFPYGKPPLLFALI